MVYNIATVEVLYWNPAGLSRTDLLGINGSLFYGLCPSGNNELNNVVTDRAPSGSPEQAHYAHRVAQHIVYDSHAYANNALWSGLGPISLSCRMKKRLPG